MTELTGPERHDTLRAIDLQYDPQMAYMAQITKLNRCHLRHLWIVS